MSAPDPACPSCGALQARVAELEAEVARLRAREADLAPLPALVAQLQTRLAQLEARLNQNSRNSSRPPSSDPPFHSKPAPKPPPTGRKPGGQPGHPGKTRFLKPPEAVDAFVDLFPASCARCHAGLPEAPADSDPEPWRHQVVELPPRFLYTTEYRCHARTCPRCRTLTYAPLPPGVPAGILGDRLQAFCALMVGRYQVSRRALTEWLREVGGEAVSLGYLSGLESRIAAALAAPYEQVRQAVIAAPAVNADESPWREGTAKGWLWTATTPWASLFRIDPKRSRAALERLLPPTAPGAERTVTSDRHRAYLHLKGRNRQLCWSHLARDFQALAELQDEAQAIGEAALVQTRELFRLWHAFRAGEIERERLVQQMRPVQARLARLLRRARDSGHWKAAGLGRDLLRQWESLFTFLVVEGVEPTNNAAERAIRPAVLWRKRSFGNQSERGRAFVERMLTVVGTLRLQGRNVMEYLEAALQAAAAGREAPALVKPVLREPPREECASSTCLLSDHSILCLAA